VKKGKRKRGFRKADGVSARTTYKEKKIRKI
jgi:hypothetical protein